PAAGPQRPRVSASLGNAHRHPWRLESRARVGPRPPTYSSAYAGSVPPRLARCSRAGGGGVSPSEALAMKVALAATAPFGAAILEGLASRGYDIEFLLTRPDKPQGRGRKKAAPPAKVTANELDIPV